MQEVVPGASSSHSWEEGRRGGGQHLCGLLAGVWLYVGLASAPSGSEQDQS